MGKGCTPLGRAFADTVSGRPGPKVRSLEAGEVLFRQGDDCDQLHWVRSGVFALKRVDARGNQSVVALAFEGDVLGYECLVGAGARWSTAEAGGRSEVRSAPSGDFLRALDPDTHEELLASLARDLNRAHELQLVIAHWNAADRLCWVLHEMMGRMRAIGTLRLPLCRQDLASWIGVRPETLARAIRELRARGIAEFSGRNVRFDTSALSAAVNGLDVDQEPATGDMSG